MTALKAILVGTTVLATMAVARTAAPDQAVKPKAAPSEARIAPEARRAFFGELHLHTTMSFDAWVSGTKVTPDMAYRFARGETVMVPVAQVAKEQGVKSDAATIPARRAWPLDFTAVTDHSEFIGAVAQLDVPGSRFSQSAFGKEMAKGGRQQFFEGARVIEGEPGPAADDMRAAAQDANAWAVEIKAANANYRPGKFTTFIGYEWTASPGQGIHMHRNVLFNADHAPAPFTGVDSNRPEDLWKYLESVRAQGIDVLAIPH
ncbi:MAG: DUF3604 domain-containing protein, partial [Proteobacteria bacterium]|nr:DUF3604 domain-containing protein [Pseudomonadota bacterium]